MTEQWKPPAMTNVLKSRQGKKMLAEGKVQLLGNRAPSLSCMECGERDYPEDCEKIPEVFDSTTSACWIPRHGVMRVADETQESA